MIINYFYILKRNEDANMDLKKILLTKVAKVSEYTAEQGDGWPTYWGFHEIIPDSDIKTILAKKKNEKKNLLIACSLFPSNINYIFIMGNRKFK